MVGPEQVTEAGTGVGGSESLPWHIVLDVSLPKAVVSCMSVQGATCCGNMDEVRRGQVRENGSDQLSGQDKKTGLCLGFCMSI